MRSIVNTMMLSAAVLFGLGVNPASAQHNHSQHEHGAKEHGEEAGHSHERAEGHGGAVTMSKEFHIETVFLPDQVRLYLYDGSQNPIHVKHWKNGLVEATGVVDYRDRRREAKTLKFVRGTPGKNDMPESTLWSCTMHPDQNGKAAAKCPKCGMMFTPQDYLVAAADFSGLRADDARVRIDLMNLPGRSERTLRFMEKFVPVKMHEEGEHSHGGQGHGDHDQNHNH